MLTDSEMLTLDAARAIADATTVNDKMRALIADGRLFRLECRLERAALALGRVQSRHRRTFLFLERKTR